MHQKLKKTKVDYNHTYYMKHKTENHKRQMLSSPPQLPDLNAYPNPSPMRHDEPPSN